jgi:uncharacterized protein (DUF1778 family)
MATVKDDRLQLRVNPQEKQLLEQAAVAAHLSVSAFVLRAAQIHAEDILAERQVIHLSRKAAKVLTEALERPAAVNERLAMALRRPRKFEWLD